ncbi:hypothetical protein GCM10011348_42460 [Marinobacterium nitratireducens]|uniref:HPP transmembrane region domain-containing protein n=1 Tax=Marinobacterium nitratireducens TaxID=518897 RepID=A0A917ZQT8_9GAMM|nr:HPP family protein [Marinobacterium nitratireducens]GGO88000.1 hypothetical protein GCM10011348_42460 [Marinobacterium nitratireducens]
MSIGKRFNRVLQLLLPNDPNRASHGERWLSAIGGFLGIAGLLWISSGVLDLEGATMVIGSMGATAVLLFAVPHGALSQPWAVVGGHLLSALIGVSCARLIGPPELAAATAVAVATGVMYYLHCIHPPGGATAMVAVLGGDAIRELGYGFVLYPVMANLLILMLIAVVLNWPFRHRRYPAVLARPRHREPASEARPELTHDDFTYALAEVDSFIDVSEQDLLRIYRLARQHHSREPLTGERPAANDEDAQQRRRS